MTRQEAQQFIAEQNIKMAEHNVTGMTRRQRARVEALDVISREDQAMAIAAASLISYLHGRPPHGDTGQMRVYNFKTGEVKYCIAPRRRLDVELDEAIEAIV